MRRVRVSRAPPRWTRLTSASRSNRWMSCRNSLICALAIVVSACHPRARPSAPASPTHAVDRLHTAIDGVLGAPELRRGYWGVLVKSLKTGETLYAVNADKLF